MIVITAKVRDKSRKFVGVASELEIFPDNIGPRPNISWKTDWTITTVKGTLFASQDEWVPQAHIPAFSQLSIGENWQGSIVADTSFGPHSSGRGVMVGGTGVYAGRTGTFIERVDLQGLTTDGRFSGIIYLQVYLDPK
jgi:hypothetical protein